MRTSSIPVLGRARGFRIRARRRALILGLSTATMAPFIGRPGARTGRPGSAEVECPMPAPPRQGKKQEKKHAS